MCHLHSLPVLGLFALTFLAVSPLPMARGQSAAGRVLSADEKAKLLTMAGLAQKAVKEWNAEEAIKLTPQFFVQKLGEENFRRQLQATFAECKEDGLRFLETTFGEPTPVHLSGTHEVCFVPRTSIVQTRDGKYHSKAFWVAVREQGTAAWGFLDGAPVHANPKALWGMFPGLPEGLTFPEWSQKPVE